MGPFEPIGQALALDRGAFATLAPYANGLRNAVWIVVLAGLSHALGQSVGLFVSRVSPRRFVISLLLSTLIFLMSFLMWSWSSWGIARLIFGRTQTLIEALAAVGLAYSPQLFGFFILTPYLGSFLAVSLSIWTLLATLVALQVTLGLDLFQAFACASLGWLATQALQRIIGRPIIRLAATWRRALARRSQRLSNNQPQQRGTPGEPP